MKKLRQTAAVILTILVIALFIWYIHSHPSLLDSLKKVSVLTIISILFLYGLSLITIILILYYSVLWCGKTMTVKQNVLLTAYSTLVNFFGPLQSGPGFRAIYLKAKNGVNLRNFIKISLVYYAFLSWYSGMFLFIGAHKWLLSLVVFFGGILFVVIVYFTKFKKFRSLINADPKNMIKIGVVTLIQVIILTTIYFVELKSFNHGVRFSQAMSYTGAANFSLFVSLTPGAIGFREAFVLFTQHLSRLNSTTIIAASVLDRAIYFIYLGLIFVFTLSVHAKNFLGIRRLTNREVETK